MNRQAWLRPVGAAAAGGILFAAFPPRDLWFLAPVALGVLYACLTVGRPSAKAGAATGAVFGLAFFLPLLPWIGEFVGAFPWIALSVTLAVFTALFGLLATVTMRLPAAPIWFALWWVAIETIRSAFPFGGFPWGGAAFSQNEGYLLPLARWLGVPGLSFAVALIGAGAAAIAIAVIGKSGVRPLSVAAAALVVPLGVAGLAGLTAPDPHIGPTLQVAAVQGNVPRMGLDFNAQRRQVLDNHLRETRVLQAQVDAGTVPQPDVVLWPENASDISPLDNLDARQVVQTAVGAVGVPLVFGSLLFGDDGRPTNSVLVWSDDDGRPAQEPSARYDKHIVQPFGEYLPWRSFFRLFSSYADMAGDFQPGHGPSAIPVDTPAGTVDLGVATCWEVAFDRAPRQSVRDGAQLLFVPTNNATFGFTEMTYQQLAMSQVRAVETDRSVAVVSTSGVSALVEPDGRIVAESGIFTPDVLDAALPLRETVTPAVRLAGWPKLIVLICAVLGFLYAVGRHTRFETFRVRPASEDDAAQATAEPGRDETPKGTG